MKYEKIAAHILKNMYKEKRMLIDDSDPNNIMVCLDNVMIVNFPKDLFPFISEWFERADLHRLTKDLEYDGVEGHLTNRSIKFDKRTFYEIQDEQGRLIYIDIRYLDLYGFNEPLFIINTNNQYAPVLVYDTFGGATRKHWQAAIMPAKIEV